jgi:hypothetical protein
MYTDAVVNPATAASATNSMVAAGSTHEGSTDWPRMQSAVVAITTQTLDPIADAVIIDAFGAWSAAERFTVRSLCVMLGRGHSL